MQIAVLKFSVVSAIKKSYNCIVLQLNPKLIYLINKQKDTLY